jgi:heterotetrameric sarcosine oxidase delta subunit
MRINCPYCGTRDVGEFSYLGDASLRRPELVVDESGAVAAGVEDAFFEHVYMRDNPAGEMDEYWYHSGGCRAWLVVTRNTLTHTISSVRAAPGAGASAAKKEGVR